MTIRPRMYSARRIALHAFAALAVCCNFLCMVGCGEISTLSPRTSVDGVWLGEGEFRARGRSLDVKAQLELLSDGTYRFLVLEPAVLALTGTETGTWQVAGGSLTLTPGVIKPKDKPQPDDASSPDAATPPKREGVLQKLRDTSDARPPRTLNVNADMTQIAFDDGKLSITYTPNATATEKLRAAGEVTSP